MGLFPQQFIDDLRLQANIVQVVQEYVPLKRAGTSYKGLCPFHSEKTPSFNVNPDKGFFHCFGCGVGGDVFKFLELHEKVGFQDAVRMLAQKFGVAAPRAREGARRRCAPRCGAAGSAAEGARDRGGVLPRAARGAGRRAGARSSSPSAASRRRRSSSSGLGSRRRARDGLKARLLKQGFAQGVLLQSGLVVPARQRRGRRSLPQPADGADLPRYRIGDRLRRPADGRRPGRPEVPELARDADLLEGPDAVRPEPDQGADPARSASRCWSKGYFDFAQVFQSQAAPASPPAAPR